MNRIRHGGFTLLELIVLLVIVGILATMAAPRFARFDGALAAQAQKLVSDVRHMQAMAMNQGRTLTLSVPSAGTYRVSAGGSVVTDPATMRPLEVVLDSTITLNGVDTSMDSLGRPVDSGNLLTTERLLVLAGRSRTVTVSISPITGFVSIRP